MKLPSYLDLRYPKYEYGENEYPQKLCDYISERYFTNRGKLLDIGCARGNHLVGFQRYGFEVYGLDKNIDTILKRVFEVRECDIDKEFFPYNSNTFDCVFSKSVLEHVSNTDNFLNETLRVLKPGGRAVIMTPDWESQSKNFWDDHTHVRPFTRKGLQEAMVIAGFKNVQVSLFLQLPFVWRHPWLGFVPKLVSLLPDSLKWKDYEQRNHRKLIRFSKEKMLLGVGEK